MSSSPDCNHLLWKQRFPEVIESRWLTLIVSFKLPLVAATLGPSAFGISPMHDTLTLAWADRHAGDGSSICLPLLFHLIEGALGYERVYVDASCWQYRRDEAFRQ